MLVLVYVPPNAHLLEMGAFCDAFFEANRAMQTSDAYDVRIVARAPGELRSASGVRFLPDSAFLEQVEPPDTLVVTGGYGLLEPPDDEVVAWLRTQSASSRRFGSTCTGVFHLAAAGLLAGRRVTTHWQFAERLAADYPEVIVEPDRIFVRDGPVFSSAGVSSALDLALSLIEEDHGRQLALWVARRLVVYLKRPGGQSQFSVHLTAQAAVSTPLERVQQYIMDHPRGDLGVPALARIAGQSVRAFSRQFAAESGMTPARYVELARIDSARRMLEETDLPIKQVIHAAGFGSETSARRAFLRNVGCSLADYRSRFRTTATGS